MSGADSSSEECALQIDVGQPVKAKRGREKSQDSKWKPGDIVWAKVSGFNYWPAKVAD